MYKYEKRQEEGGTIAGKEVFRRKNRLDLKREGKRDTTRKISIALAINIIQPNGVLHIALKNPPKDDFIYEVAHSDFAAGER